MNFLHKTGDGKGRKDDVNVIDLSVTTSRSNKFSTTATRMVD